MIIILGLLFLMFVRSLIEGGHRRVTLRGSLGATNDICENCIVMPRQAYISKIIVTRPCYRRRRRHRQHGHHSKAADCYDVRRVMKISAPPMTSFTKIVSPSAHYHRIRRRFLISVDGCGTATGTTLASVSAVVNYILCGTCQLLTDYAYRGRYPRRRA